LELARVTPRTFGPHKEINEENTRTGSESNERGQTKNGDIV